MNLLKRFFKSSIPEQSAPAPKKYSSFKEEMINDIIPRVAKMIEKEQAHLIWLESKKAPQEFIDRSRFYLAHFKASHREYNEYANGL